MLDDLWQGLVNASNALSAAANARPAPSEKKHFSFLTNRQNSRNRAAAPIQIPQPPDPDALDPTPRVRQNPPPPLDLGSSAPKTSVRSQARAETSRQSPLPDPNQTFEFGGQREIDPGEVRRIVREVLAEGNAVPTKVDVALQVDLPNVEEQESFSLSGITERLFPVLLPLRACCSTSLSKRKDEVVAMEQLGAMKARTHVEQKEQRTASHLGAPICACAASTCAIGLCSAGALAAGAGPTSAAIPCACAASTCAAGACVTSACVSRLDAKARWIEQVTRETPQRRATDLEPPVVLPVGTTARPQHCTISDPDALVCEPRVWHPLRRPRAEVLRPDPGSLPQQQAESMRSLIHPASQAPTPPAASPEADAQAPELYGRKVPKFKLSRI
mmetsp:Transcript_140995/g.351619  ORF Transcript_140995/g.351619 Transcript_140995/m.351619 type:complete len:388 (-) Transcript_140995:150-1313(-)